MRPRGLIGLAVMLAIVRITWHCWRTVRPRRAALVLAVTFPAILGAHLEDRRRHQPPIPQR